MYQKQDFIGIKSPLLGIAPEVNGAPSSVHGGNDGKDKTTMVVEQSPSANNTSSDDDQIKADAVAGINNQISTLSDIIEQIGYKPESKEDIEKRERREKSKRIIAAVSDGISALSNLYYTSQYAPNMYNHERDSQTGAVYAGIERAKAEREKQREQHLRFALKLGDLKTQRAATLRELEEQHERQKLAREKAEREAEAHGWAAVLQPDIQREQAGKANKAEQEAITAKAVAEYAPEMQRKKGAVEDARAASYRASAGASSASAEASRARAGYYRNGGSARTKKHHFRGKEYISEKDYTKDVTEAARQYNERHKDEEGFVPIVIEREERTGTGKRIVARKPEEYAGEVERRLEQEDADNRPPSRKNNDNRPPTRQ